MQYLTHLFFLFALSCISHASIAQKNRYAEKINAQREHYKNEFLQDARSPLKAADTGFLRFYPPHPGYLIQADFVRINDEKGFDMQTHSGVVKKYYVYGFVTFRLQKMDCKLFVYQSEKLRAATETENLLFIPFTDNTNYTETFGGGRYLDLKTTDIRNAKLEIDFNLCYNPYCAYKEGYACPIPPKENDLQVSIEAGEKLFGRAFKE